jgi:hypothetical protein
LIKRFLTASDFIAGKDPTLKSPMGPTLAIRAQPAMISASHTQTPSMDQAVKKQVIRKLLAGIIATQAVIPLVVTTKTLERLLQATRKKMTKDLSRDKAMKALKLKDRQQDRLPACDHCNLFGRRAVVTRGIPL